LLPLDLLKIKKMETVENKNPNRGKGRVWAALILIAVGSALILERMGLPLPGWLFSWPMVLIAFGIFIGFRHGFRGGGWIILIVIGSFFMFDDFIPEFSLHRFIWPLAIIFIGIAILLRPRRHPEWDEWKKEWKKKDRGNNDWKDHWKERERKYENIPSEDFIDATTIFGGIHKSVVSKDFKGGDITIIMGGSEINLSQADINGKAVIDITQVLGGTKLIVPPNWEIRSNLTSVFGNVEDKRTQERVTNPDKVLIIDGTCLFGGIEIKNY
jgi:predicted membrane protein